MTIVTVVGIVNADYLAFDNIRKLINVQFADNSQFTRFRKFFAVKFPEVEGPAGPAHSTYHDELRKEYDRQLAMPAKYNTGVSSEHSHFSYKSDAHLTENLIYLCQLPKIGHTCIRCSYKGTGFDELLSRILGAQIPLRGFDADSTYHLQRNQMHSPRFDPDSVHHAEGNRSSLQGFDSPSTRHRFDI